MNLPKIDFSQLDQPLKLLLEGNEDTWSSMLAVVADLTVEQLAYKHPGYNQRSIAEMVNHALDTQYGFYTTNLVVGEALPKPLYKDSVKTVEETPQRIINVYQRIVRLWKSLKDKDLSKEIKTEWGQVLTGELALFQSITHTHYHVSEICFLRGLGGFPTQVMG